MKFYSTNKKTGELSFKEAVIKGIADDGGLFMPAFIPILPKKFFNEIKDMSFQEICFEIATAVIGDEISSETLMLIINKAINFNAPLVELDENLNILELFHGPTLAFKDFGARFMAEIVSHYSKEYQKKYYTSCSYIR